MASATYESVRAVRAAIAAERGRGGPGVAAEGRRRPFLRGVAASALITAGYVALMTGARWLLGALLG